MTDAKKRQKGLINVGIGVVLATALAGLAAWQAGDLSIIVVRILAGIFASVEAAQVHDGQTVVETIRDEAATG